MDFSALRNLIGNYQPIIRMQSNTKTSINTCRLYILIFFFKKKKILTGGATVACMKKRRRKEKRREIFLKYVLGWAKVQYFFLRLS